MSREDSVRRRHRGDSPSHVVMEPPGDATSRVVRPQFVVPSNRVCARTFGRSLRFTIRVMSMLEMREARKGQYRHMVLLRIKDALISVNEFVRAQANRTSCSS